MMENDYAIKVAKYPPNLGGDDYPEEDEFGPGAKMLRGPGQKSSDPFQFVAATKGGADMAETAKSTLQMAQQQKVQREKMLQGQRQSQKFDDSEPWQADLDTWRRKRKEKFGDRASSEATETTRRAEEYTSYLPRKTKEEILEVNSATAPRAPLPRQHSASTVSPLRSSSDDLNNDSGIDNRTVESPSTSEFSPRSTDLFVSPKSLLDEEPPHHPPPPPPVDEKLDQVLIPLKYSRTQEYAPVYRSIEKSSHYYDQTPEEKDKEDLSTSSYVESTRAVEKNSYMPVTSARVEATFKQPPQREGVKPFVSRAAQELEQRSLEQKVENIDLTVELNREQKATVTATKYPRSDFIMEEHRPTHAPPLKSSSSSRIYHAVDIPFDESPATYHPKQHIYQRANSHHDERRYSASNGYSSKQDGLFTLNIVMGSQPVHKGMGFTTSKRDDRVLVESVIVGSPADKAGLLVGDTILSINGEEMADKYQSGVTRILHEAARVGEADVLILRAPAPTPLMTKQASTSSINSSNFDKARSVFADNRSFDSYAEFKRKHSRASRDSNSTSSRSSRDYNSLPRGATTGASLDRKRDASLSSYRTAKDNFNSSSARSSGRSEYGDYRVTSYQEKNAPGRLTDFVPEVDRRLSRRERSEEIYAKTRNSGGVDDEPRTIRNYHLSNENIARTNLNFDGRRDSEEESTTTTLKRSTLPRSGTATHWRNDYSDGDEIDEKVASVTQNTTITTPREPSPLRSALKKSSHNYYPVEAPRRYYSTESLPHQRTYFEKNQEDVEETYSSSAMRRHHNSRPTNRHHFDDYYTVGSYGVPPPTRSRSQQPLSRYDDVPYDEDGVGEDVSAVTHRFYDRAGNHVRAPRERSHDIQIQREYGGNSRTPRDLDRDLDFVRNTYQWQEQEDKTVTTTTKIYEQESRDWRDVINQQRQAAPGYSADRRGIAATSSSLSNLPGYINRRLEKEKEREYVREREYSMPPVEQQQQPVVTEKYERDEYSRIEERTFPTPVQRNNMRREETQVQQQSQSHVQKDDSVVAVSGKHRCAHCNEELGRGAAMIVESLNLFYHLACFKCYVCKTSLGSGATGADVRVRDGRLHCQACYSNDRVQLSKV